MAARVALITGFEPFGGLDFNPSLEVARELDGTTIAGTKVAGRSLPVSYKRLAPALEAAVRELRPALVIALGLAGGEPVLRLERFGVNLEDAALADNDRVKARGRPIAANGPVAFAATLPLEAIRAALVTAGIPARLSNSAGAYLCNACLYNLGRMAEDAEPPFLYGFVHLPYAPHQAARLLKADPDRLDVASMDVRLMAQAVAIAIETAAQSNVSKLAAAARS